VNKWGMMGKEEGEIGFVLPLCAPAPLCVPPPPERHSAEAEEWSVYVECAVAAPAVLATAVSVVEGWLLLWRRETPVCVFRPGVWHGALVRYRRRNFE